VCKPIKVIAGSAALGVKRVKARRALTLQSLATTVFPVTIVPDLPTISKECAWKNGVRKYDANSGTYYFANIHWRHIIGQYSSNRAALVDLMSNFLSEIDQPGVLVSGAYFFPMRFH
jgi:hypothetical protein